MPNQRYAILRACLTQYAAVLDFTERVGRRPERVHFAHGWWWLGYVNSDEAKLWIENEHSTIEL